MWELHDHRHYTGSKMASGWRSTARSGSPRRESCPAVHGRWREERDASARLDRGALLVGGARCLRRLAGQGEPRRGAPARRAAWATRSSERFDSTVDVIRERLGGRRPGCSTGRASTMREEGAFVACSFWLVEAWRDCGRVDEAARRSSRSSRTRTTSGSLRGDRPGERRVPRQLPAGAEPPGPRSMLRGDPGSRGAGASATAGAAHVERRGDEREVRERLREVAEQALRLRVVLLAKQADVVREAEQPLEQLVRLVVPAEQLVAVDEPERARQEHALARPAARRRRPRACGSGATKPSCSRSRSIAVDRAAHARVGCGKEADERDQRAGSRRAPASRRTA